MTQEQSKPAMQRVKLHIESVEPPKAYGDKGRKLVNFQAKPEGAEKALRYTAFRDTLFEALKVGATIEADVETKTRPSDDPERPFVDRNIQQIYVDGQPIGGQRGQGRGWGRSPEEIAAERLSIEGQVAVKEVGEMLRWGYPLGTEIVGLYLRALRTRLAALVSPTPTEVVLTATEKAIVSTLLAQSKRQFDKDMADLFGGPDRSASPSPAGDVTPPPFPARGGSATAPGHPQTEVQAGQAQQPVASKNGGGAEPRSEGQILNEKPPAEAKPTKAVGFANWGEVAGEIMKLPANKGRNSGVVAKAVWAEATKRHGVEVNSWSDMTLIADTPQQAFAIAWEIGQELANKVAGKEEK